MTLASLDHPPGTGPFAGDGCGEFDPTNQARHRLRAGRGSALLLLATFTTVGAFAGAFHNPYGKSPTNSTPGDRMFANYFRAETRTLAERSLTEIQTLEDWQQQKEKYRGQLFEMLGLDPVSPKTDLKATITGTVDHPEFTVEKLHFQSMPGLYVSANLYVPKKLEKTAPAILYVCGHAPVKTNGISYGCKVAYQKHGIWFARNGYVCLVLDSVELGEIEGRHHGTYRDGMWWWNSRGYSSAAAEAWNCIRALDYLETRPEVDKTRFGVTGRSGGGAYSWWIAALDERIKAACPVAGITDLENHVVDGVVEGHCDCMFMANTYRWDYAQVAALVSPRPLLICNSDKDTIFPLDGVTRLHEKVRRIYDLQGASDKIGLLITEGPHKDTQDLQVPVFRWFNRFLKKEEPLVEMAAVPLFSGQQLKVFDKLPADEITSKCYENFTKLAGSTPPFDAKKALADLQQKTFGGWPAAATALGTRQLASVEYDGVRLTVHEFESQSGVTLRFYLARPVGVPPTALHVEAVDETNWRRQLELARAGFAPAFREEFALAGVKTDAPVPREVSQQFVKWMRYIRDNQAAYITFPPRSIGLSTISDEKLYRTQMRRRFMLLGQTLAGMQVWDIRRAVQSARELEGLATVPVHFHASPEMAEVATFAAVFEPNVSSLTLPHEPRTDKEAPDFLNWSRIVTPQQLLALAQERCKVVFGASDNSEVPSR
jgi:dienelactone hydrolase